MAHQPASASMWRRLIISLVAALIMLAPGVDAFACAGDDFASVVATSSSTTLDQEQAVASADADVASKAVKTPACPCGGHCHAHQSVHAVAASAEVRLTSSGVPRFPVIGAVIRASAPDALERPPRA